MQCVVDVTKCDIIVYKHVAVTLVLLGVKYCCISFTIDSICLRIQEWKRS